MDLASALQVACDGPARGLLRRDPQRQPAAQRLAGQPVGAQHCATAQPPLLGRSATTATASSTTTTASLTTSASRSLLSRLHELSHCLSEAFMAPAVAEASSASPLTGEQPPPLGKRGRRWVTSGGSPTRPQACPSPGTTLAKCNPHFDPHILPNPVPNAQCNADLFLYTQFSQK
jgi:hypothetical protein